MLVVEEELRDEEVRAGFDLQPHVAKLVLDVWALGMLFRAARGADAEAVSAPAHKGDEVAPVRELRIGGDERLTGCRRVAAKCEHVRDAFALHPVQDLPRPIGGVGACEVGHRFDVVVPFDACHQLECLLAGAHAVGDRDPVRGMAGEGRNRALQRFDLALVARRHELERDAGLAPSEHVCDSHRCGNFIKTQPFRRRAGALARP